MSKLIDLTGQHFGKLTVLYRLKNASTTTWVCQCECGNICNVRSGNLRSGHTQSCGCLKKERAKEIGLNNLNNLIGKKFNYLTVIEKGKTKQGTNWKWLCRCDCGVQKEIAGADLVTGKIKSCGCQHNKLIGEAHLIDMIGERFGKLTVLSKANKDPDGSFNYLCQCDCGNKKIINGVNLRRGITTSCGCINYSIGEKNIATILSNNNIQYVQEYIVSELNNKRFDFAILNNNKIIRLIEFDGIQHFKSYSTPEWEDSCPLAERQQRDQIKNQWAKEHNIPLVRIPYWERDNITLDMIMGDQYLLK